MSAVASRMQQRTVLISPYSMGALDALRSVFSDIAKVGKQEPLNIDALFASTIFQAGIDRFLTLGDSPSDHRPAQFIAERTSIIKPPDLNDLYGRIGSVFESQQRSKRDKNDRVRHVSGLIVDLIVAARYKTSLVTTLPLEDISDYKDTLQPEFFTALECFFASFEHDAAAVPLPKTVARVVDIHRLQTILNSDLFTDYSRTHNGLEEPKTKMHQQLRRVEDAARNLTQGFSDYLSIRNLVISGLSITGKAVEAFLGTLPASVLAPFQKFLEAYFSTDHRVIIYDFYGVWRAHFEGEIRRLVEQERGLRKTGRIQIEKRHNVQLGRKKL